ncbi:unnamed protein product [Blepharisma stoltei]|uniref:Glutathione S-transferase n=1 Tax=Blepharisma stoltei TaxID=1481888 RepID=A0AAU9IHL8_9CILI|nr:unnamed protein product [Blepharisma stoltei]
MTTLHYFDFYGRAEVIRFALHAFNEPFIDHCITPEEFLKTKRKNEFGLLPCLEIDGMVLVQSKSILRYLCQKHNAYPLEMYRIYQTESIIDAFGDIKDAIAKERMGKNEEESLRWINENMPRWFGILEKRLVENDNGGSFYVGDTPTMSDFVSANFIYDFFMRPGKEDQRSLLETHGQLLKAHTERLIDFYPSLKAYLASRQQKEF